MLLRVEVVFCYFLFYFVRDLSAIYLWKISSETLSDQSMITSKNKLTETGCINECELNDKCGGFQYENGECSFFLEGTHGETKVSTLPIYVVDRNSFVPRKFLRCFPHFKPVPLTKCTSSGQWKVGGYGDCMRDCLDVPDCSGFYLDVSAPEMKCRLYQDKEESSGHLANQGDVVTVIKYVLENSCHTVCQHDWTDSKTISHQNYNKLNARLEECLQYCSDNSICLSVVLSMGHHPVCYVRVVGVNGSPVQFLAQPVVEITFENRRCTTRCSVSFQQHPDNVLAGNSYKQLRYVTKSMHDCEELCRRDPLCNVYEVISGDPWVNSQNVVCQLLHDVERFDLEPGVHGFVGIKIYFPCMSENLNSPRGIEWLSYSNSKLTATTKSHSATTFEDCKSHCEALHQCAAFQVETKEKIFFMQGSLMNGNEGIISCNTFENINSNLWITNLVNHHTYVKVDAYSLPHAQVVSGLP